MGVDNDADVNVIGHHGGSRVIDFFSQKNDDGVTKYYAWSRKDGAFRAVDPNNNDPDNVYGEVWDSPVAVDIYNKILEISGSTFALTERETWEKVAQDITIAGGVEQWLAIGVYNSVTDIPDDIRDFANSNDKFARIWGLGVGFGGASGAGYGYGANLYSRSYLGVSRSQGRGLFFRATDKGNLIYDPAGGKGLTTYLFVGNWNKAVGYSGKKQGRHIVHFLINADYGRLIMKNAHDQGLGLKSISRSDWLRYRNPGRLGIHDNKMKTFLRYVKPGSAKIIQEK